MTTPVLPHLRRLGQRPGFWLWSYAVFIANALLSAARRQWLLALVQAITALMSAISAGAAMRPHGPWDNRNTELPLESGGSISGKR